MPNVKSAEKRVKTNERRRQRNRAAKAVLRTSLKRVGALAAGQDIEALKKAAVETISVIGKTRRKHVINRKRAARLQSRVQRSINKALAPAPEKTA